MTDDLHSVAERPVAERARVRHRLLEAADRLCAEAERRRDEALATSMQLLADALAAGDPDAAEVRHVAAFDDALAAIAHHDAARELRHLLTRHGNALEHRRPPFVAPPSELPAREG